MVLEVQVVLEVLVAQEVQEEEILTGPVIQEDLVGLVVLEGQEVQVVLVVQVKTVLTVQRVPFVLEDQVDQEVQEALAGITQDVPIVQ